MSTPIHQVDAFSEAPFGGNPAAVCVLERAASEPWMQSVAEEMNLSETAFLHREGDGWRLRWFTPTVEVDLCGHATLASAHVLWETERAGRNEPLRFETKSGALGARLAGSRIELDFPAKPAHPSEPASGLMEALGVRAVATGRSAFDWLVELESEDAVRACAPDFAALGRVQARGVIITSRSSDARFDFVSRFFAPGSGIDEDPVTGSAHCVLAPWWSGRLGRRSFTAFQASSRGGTLWLELVGDRVKIAGHAVTVMRGELATGPR